MKKKNLFINLVILLLMLALVFTLVACNDSKDNSDSSNSSNETTDKLTEGLLIDNSDFKVPTTGTSYPYNPSNWGWKGAAFSSSAYPQGVTAGIVDFNSTAYESSKSIWDNLANPNAASSGTDTRGLMIYMPESSSSSDTTHGPTAYGFTSNSFKILKNSYYRLSVSVKTVNIKGNAEKGARIYLSSTAYAEFNSIDTNGEWKTYEILIEGSKANDYSLTLNLALGYYSSTISTAQLTTGYVFFDDLSLVKIEDTAGKTAYDQYNETVQNAQTKKITYLVPNGEFDYGTLVAGNSTATPYLWTAVTGGANTSFSAPTTYRYNGLVNTQSENFTSVTSKLSTARYIYTPEITIYTQDAWNALSQEEKDAFDSNAVIADGADAGKIKAVKHKISAVDYTKLPSNPLVPTGAVGNNVYMLSQVYMTAQGIKSNTPIVVERGSYTKISVSVYTQDVFGQGVSIRLSGNGDDFGFKDISKTVISDEKEIYKVWDTAANEFVYYDIDGNKVTAANYTPGTTGGWSTYSIILKGNDYMDTSFTLELWLGTGDTSENTKKTISSYTSSGYASKQDFTTYKSDGTFSKGFAFFDNITISKATSADFTSYGAQVSYESSKEDRLVSGTQNLAVDLQTSNELNSNPDFGSSTHTTSYDAQTLGSPSNWTTQIVDGKIDGVSLSNQTVAGVVDTSSDTLFNSLELKNPNNPLSFGASKILMVYSPSNQIYKFESDSFTLIRNNAYRISVWLKTENIPSTSGLRVSLLNSDTDEVLKSSSVINTEEIENSYYNDWVEYTFIIKGYSDKDLNASLLLEYGYGDRWSATTLAKGAGYFANASCTNIPLTTYTSLSSSTTNSTSVSYETTESSKTIANGSFNLINLEKTEGLVGGLLSGDVGVPKNWTKTDNTLDNQVKGGIIKFDSTDDLKFYNSNQITNLIASYPALSTLGTTSTSIYDTWVAPNGGPSALLIANIDAAKQSLGFKSDSISLSANSYYKISVFKYSVGTTKYSIYLDSENTVKNYFDESPYFSSTASGWTEFTFYIEVGLKSVSLNLGLWLGDNTDVISYANEEDAKTDGYVIYDSVVCTTLNEEEFSNFDSARANSRKLSFLTDGFDTQSNNAESKSKLTSATGWTGAAGTDCIASNTKSGIYYYSGSEGTDYVVSDLFGLDLAGTQNQTNGLYYKNSLLTDDFYLIADTAGKLYSDSALTTLNNEGKYFKKSETETIVLQTTTVDSATVLAKYDINETERNASFITYANLAPHSGQYALAINNTKDSCYYYNGTTYTLTKESYYKVSVYVKTNMVAENNGAYVALTASGLNYTKAEKTFSKINNETWTEYVFFIKTADEDLSSVYVTLGLGQVIDSEDTSSLASGYALFDDFSIEKIDETTYEGAVESTTIKKMAASESDITTGNDDEDNSDTTPYEPDLSYLAWMIPTILLAVAVIIVFVVLIVRKIKAKYPSKGETKTASYNANSNSSESIERKQDIYESKFNEDDGIVIEKSKKEKKQKNQKDNN